MNNESESGTMEALLNELHNLPTQEELNQKRELYKKNEVLKKKKNYIKKCFISFLVSTSTFLIIFSILKYICKYL